MTGSSSHPRILLDHHLKALKLPVFLREQGKVATQCASDKADYAEFLLRLAELLKAERKYTRWRLKSVPPRTKVSPRQCGCPAGSFLLCTALCREF